jgi:hypothetical protein
MSYYLIFNDTYQYLFTQSEFVIIKDLDLENFSIIEILPEIIIESDIGQEIEEVYSR